MISRVVILAAFVCAVALPTSANAASFAFGGAGFSESLCPGLDAGNTPSTPCLVVGGPFGHIDGSLDPVTDIDFYAFHWGGGQLGAAYATGTAEIYLSLFPYPSTNATAPLVATSYSIVVNNFTTGDTTTAIQGLSTSAVPEPATLVLCSAGLLAVLRRRRT